MRGRASPLRLQSRRQQRGAALIIVATVLVMGVAWFTVGALGKAAPSVAQREIETGRALQEAKRALLGYIAQYAARTNFEFPGRMPCPESPNSIGTANEGLVASACSNTAAVVGRFPWRTIGVEQLRDGDREPLWYVLSPNFHPTSFPLNAAPPNPWLNLDTPPQLPFDGTMVVALIIAPGRALNTLSDPAAPPAGCPKVNQQVLNRYVAPLNPANFLECGNASGSYENRGTSPWTNDRVVSITAADWQDAITGAVADRLQRQVAPAIASWNEIELSASGRSWSSAYLPLASPFGDPAANGYCGGAAIREGLLPVAATPACDTNWSSASAALLVGMTLQACSADATEMRCTFLSVLDTGPLSARITADAANVAGSFRRPIIAPDITTNIAGSSITNFSLTASGVTGGGTVQFDVSLPPPPLSTVVEVLIPHLANAAVLADASLAWFLNNRWQRHTYYAVAPSATASSATPCGAPGDAGCLEVHGLPASSGNYWDKRFVLVLAGRPISGQSRSGAGAGDITQYLEADNASPNDRSFRASFFVANPAAAAPPYPPFNDRVAACPFQHTPQTGGPVTLCN